MTTTVTTNKPLAIFPDIPRNVPLVDENRMMTDPWLLFFDQLAAALHTNLKPEGFVIPQQTTANISQLNGSQSIANIIYDSNLNAFFGNINGVWTEFQMGSSGSNDFLLFGP